MEQLQEISPNEANNESAVSSEPKKQRRHSFITHKGLAITMIQDKMPGRITAEEKYDGERIQAHKVGNRIILFSRRLDDITDQFPDIVAQIRKNIRARNCVIEGEAVAIDKKGNLPRGAEDHHRRGP